MASCRNTHQLLRHTSSSVVLLPSVALICSVLDRLNPLLEPGGVLPLTECGTSPDEDRGDEAQVGGTASSSSSHRVIRPHPNFRLFLTADPSCGEVSRAMRNRCVEISLLNAPPAVAVVAPPPAATTASGREVSHPVTPVNEHASDLLSLVRLAGLSDAAEATAAVAVHSALVARRSRGKDNASAGEGPAPRALFLWAELVAASRARTCGFTTDDGGGDDLRRCLSLAYPGLSPGVGSAAEVKLAEAVLESCLPDSPGAEPRIHASDKLLESLVPGGWMELVNDSVAGQVSQDLKLLKAVCMTASPTGLTEDERCLLSLVVDSLDGQQSPPSTLASDLRLDEEDASLLHTSAEASSRSTLSSELVAHAAVLFARRASPSDRLVRVASAARMISPSPLPRLSFARGALSVGLGEAVPAMIAVLYDSEAWGEASVTLSEMAAEEGAVDVKISSLGQAATLAGSCLLPADPRANPELFGSLERAFGASWKWRPFMLLLNLINASVCRRLPLLLAERGELSEARKLLRSGRGGDVGLGWFGLSCLVCDGGRDSSVVGGGRGGASCPETRLARSVLVPYLLPLFRAVDGVVEALVCRRVAELAIAEGVKFGEELLGAMTAVLESRDTLSRLLSKPPPLKTDEPGADGSAGHVSSTRTDELVFTWDPFLVAWRWLEQHIKALRSVMFGSAVMESSVNVTPGFATLAAVGARVNAAVLQHAGGAAPTRDTLWKHGPRAAAPSSAAGAISLAKLRRLADEFRILPSSHGGPDMPGVSLGTLMGQAHPALCVPLDTRREFLHALCTLRWAASNEQKDDVVSLGGRHERGLEPRPAKPFRSEMLWQSPVSGDASMLAETLPGVLEATVRAARARFEARHKGTRLGAADRGGDGLEHHQDDLEFGEKFDDFDTEAAEAVSNATLLVVSGDAEGAGGGDSAAGGGKSSGAGVLQDWALVQLSPLMEHWIAVEECHILSSLAKIDVSLACGRHQDVSGDDAMALLIARVSRLRSAILAAPSLSPLAARPHQTLLWAWDDRTSWPDVCGPLLKMLLPVAMESFGRRLWENVVGAPGTVSLRLAPPDMVAQSAADDGGQHGSHSVGNGADDAVFTGPVQLMKLARSSFLLRLSSTATFRGGVVHGGVGGGRDGMDLTLMNASARLEQFRTAMRGVRDLGYVRGSAGVSGALEPLVAMSWASLCRTLGAFDALRAGCPAVPGGEVHTFANALQSAIAAAACAAGGSSREKIQGPLLEALEACPDERLGAHGEALVLPAVLQLSRAMAAFTGPAPEGPTPLVEARAGLGMSLLGCLKLLLLLPSSPVDPGLRPALKKELLEERLGSVKGELTVRRWSLRLDGRGDVSPEVRKVSVESESASLHRLCHC